MSDRELVLFIVVGAALLALWIDVRYPQLVPEQTGRRFAHAAAAFVGAQLLAPTLVALLVGTVGTMPFQLIALFGVLLPALVYAFLVAIWLLRLLRSVLPG